MTPESEEVLYRLEVAIASWSPGGIREGVLRYCPTILNEQTGSVDLPSNFSIIALYQCSNAQRFDFYDFYIPSLETLRYCLLVSMGDNHPS
jgi:hypothetical protein